MTELDEEKLKVNIINNVLQPKKNNWPTNIIVMNKNVEFKFNSKIEVTIISWNSLSKCKPQSKL